LNAVATGASTFCRRWTTYHCSRNGKPTTSSTASWRIPSSRPMVCADRKLMPMPAITACLMVSVERISIVTFSWASNAPKPSSIEFQVSEPRSRVSHGSRSSALTGRRLRRASG